MSVMTAVIPVPAAVAAGAWTNVDGSVNKYVRLGNMGTSTVQLQGTIEDDKSDPFSIGAPLTANGWVAVPDTVKFLRWNCTAYTNGTPTSKVASNPG